MSKENKKKDFPKLQGSNSEIIRPGNFSDGSDRTTDNSYPAVYWGPDQYSNDIPGVPALIYQTPLAWKRNEFLRVPKVVRLIYDRYIHDYTQGPGPPNGNPDDARLEREITVGGWQNNAEGLTLSFLCQDPGFVFSYPTIVYVLLEGETPPPTFTPPFTPGPGGPIIPFPINPCIPEGGETHCAVNGDGPDYSTKIAIYEVHPAFPSGHCVLIFSGAILDLDGQFGVHFNDPQNCRCWYRIITVVTTYSQPIGTVQWTTTVHYLQYYHDGSHGPPEEAPDPGFNAGSHCILDPEEPDPDFSPPADLSPPGHATWNPVLGQWVPD